MEDWLTVIIILLMLGIALDGVRRMRNARRENLRLSKNAQKADMEKDFSVSSSEFPSGGARVAGYREANEAKDLNQTVKQSYVAKKTTKGAPQRIPEQVTLNLQESVPMLMDSVEVDAKHEKAADDSYSESDEENAYRESAYEDHDGYESYEDEYSQESSSYHEGQAEEEDFYEESAGSQSADSQSATYEDDYDEDGSGEVEENNRYASHNVADDYEEDTFRSDQREPQLGNLDDLDTYEAEQEEKAYLNKSNAHGASGAASSGEKTDAHKQETKKRETKKREAQETVTNNESEQAFKEPDEVIIMNIMAKAGTRFYGDELLQALMEEGLKLGAMDIFHRHLNNDGDAPVLFSLANMVVPGTFNLSEMQHFQTPGVSLFLSLPIDGGESIAAFDDLARTARNLVDKLGGELKDENRSVMTRQTIEHCRQRVVEYERKKKLARV